MQYVDRNKAAYVWPHASASDTLPASNNTAEVRTESTRTQRKVGALWDMDGPPDDLGRSPRKAADKFNKEKAKILGRIHQCPPA